MKYSFIVLLLVSLLFTGCGMFKGEKGATGADGTPGMALIKVYTGNFATANQIINTPEILNKQDAIFLNIYYAFADNPSAWMPLSDGWLDMQANCYVVFWTTGKIMFYQVTPGNYYRIEIYQHN